MNAPTDARIEACQLAVATANAEAERLRRIVAGQGEVVQKQVKTLDRLEDDNARLREECERYREAFAWRGEEIERLSSLLTIAEAEVKHLNALHDKAEARIAELEALVERLPKEPRPWMVGHEDCDEPWDAFGYWDVWMRGHMPGYMQSDWDDCDAILKANIYSLMCSVAAAKAEGGTS